MKCKKLIGVAVLAVAFLSPGLLRAQTYTLADEPLWTLSPGDREYINHRPAGETAGGYSEHGLAYNPVTGNVYLLHHSSSLGTRIAILDGRDGSHLGYLSIGSLPRPLRKIGVADDGVIFAATTAGDTSTTPYYLYRWEDESAEKELVWEGDPSGGEGNVRRSYGPNIAVRGEGASTRILVAPDWWEQEVEAHIVAVFGTDDGETFSPERYTMTPTTRFGLGTAFGEGDTFFGTRAGQPLREFAFSGELLREFDGSSVYLPLSPIGLDLEKNLLAGVHPNELRLYNLNALNTGLNPPIAIREFPTNNANIDATGEIAFGEDVVYALHTNNGVVAYPLVRESLPEPADPVEPGFLYWTNNDELRTADADGGNPRTVVSGLERPIGLAVDAGNGHVYWAEDGGRRIGRANLDGSEPEILINGLHQAQGLALDTGSERLYWAGFSTGLFVSDLDGGGVELLVELPDQQTTSVSFDSGANRIYFGTALGTHYGINPDGSGLEEVAAYAANTYGAFFDPSMNALYTTNFSSNVLERIHLIDGSSETLISEGLNEPLHLVLNDRRTVVYWAERATGSETQGRIRATQMSDPGAFTTLVENENSPFGVAIYEPALSDGFAQWIAGFPEIPEALRGAHHDPANDGIGNLLKYALGLDPRIPGRSELPEPELLTDGQGRSYLGISVDRDASAIGVSLVIEVSGDLQRWDSGPGFITLIEDTAEILSARDNTPIDESNRRFIRVRATAD